MKSYDGLPTINTCYTADYFICGFCILRKNLGWVLFTAVLLSGFTTLHYIFEAERRIKPEFILYIFRIICTVLNCFFGLTICIFALFSLCSTASSASPYVSSYYLHCAQLLPRPLCIYLRIIFTVLNCFFGLSAYPTEKRAVTYSHLTATYSYHSWNLMTFTLKKTRYFRHCGPCVLRAQMDKAVNIATGSVHKCATQLSFNLVTIL